MLNEVIQLVLQFLTAKSCEPTEMLHVSGTYITASHLGLVLKITSSL
jgi:hypothetical protein